MSSLASNANVWNTALRILRAKGFELRLEATDYDDDLTQMQYSMARDGFTFAADSPLELLALGAIYEFVEPDEDRAYWWTVDGPDILDELLGESLERSLRDMRTKDPVRWLAYVRDAMASANADASAAERLGVSDREFAHIEQDALLALTTDRTSEGRLVPELRGESLERFQALVPPPHQVGSYAQGIDWSGVETELGMRLSASYKDFVATYGSGAVIGKIHVVVPNSPSRKTNLLAVTRQIRPDSTRPWSSSPSRPTAD